jgi:hypothetical protein
MPQDEKPIERHLRDGTYIPSRHDDRLPTATFEAGTVGEPPSDLSPIALDHWQWLCDAVPKEVQSKADRYSFAAMSRLWAKYIEFDSSPADADEKTIAKRSTIAMASFRAWADLAKNYGLTAASRPRIKLPIPDDDEDDPLTQLHRLQLESEKKRAAGWTPPPSHP